MLWRPLLGQLVDASMLNMQLLHMCWLKGWAGLSWVREQKDIREGRDFKRNANNSPLAPQKTVPRLLLRDKM